VFLEHEQHDMTNSSQKKNQMPLMDLCFLFVGSFAAIPSLAIANDWGYEGAPDLPPKPVELRAQPAALIGQPQNKTSPVMKSVSPGGAAAKPSAVTTKSSVGTAKPAPPNAVPSKPAHTSLFAKPNASSAPIKPAGTVPVQPAAMAPAAVSEHVDQDKQASVCWQQLFQVAARHPLSYEQQKKFEDYMLEKAKLGGKHQIEVRSILKFWPRLVAEMRQNPDLEAGYVSLFHALLRMREAMPAEKLEVSGEINSDSDLITELLGVQRTAVPGDPPLTEEAINAYADLTCFIYEQRHPGKTVDADDNRALLARVVADKFREAPTANDRKAMAHFDLSWAKFRILWDSADAPTRKIMLDKLDKSGAGSTLALAKNPVLEQVLLAWPWSAKP
jgi:hypothetical protein